MPVHLAPLLVPAIVEFLKDNPSIGPMLTNGAGVFVNGTNALLSDRSRRDAMLLNFENSERQRVHQVQMTKQQQDHQLKMFYLQQELQKIDRIEEYNRRIHSQKDHQQNEFILRAHMQRLEKIGEPFYTPGTWISTRIPNKPAPIILFSLNPKQEFNPFRDQTPRIAPLSRIKKKFSERNNSYDGHLFTTLTTQEAFASDTEVLAFYHRELNCPCIIIYGEFTGSSFCINALYAGIHDSQVKILQDATTDFGPRVINMWEISYHNLFHIKEYHEKSTSDKAVSKYSWLDTLELYTETFVGLNLQLLVDEFFYYNPFTAYNIQLPNFIKDKEQELKAVGKYDQFKNYVDAYYDKLQIQREKFKISLNDADRNFLYAVSAENYLKLDPSLRPEEFFDSTPSSVTIPNDNLVNEALSYKQIRDSLINDSFVPGKLFHFSHNGSLSTFSVVNGFAIPNDPNIKINYHDGYAVLCECIIPEDIVALTKELEFINREKNKIVKSQKYEKAAELRDREKKIESTLKKVKQVWRKESNFDVIYYSIDRTGKLLTDDIGEIKRIHLNGIGSFQAKYAVAAKTSSSSYTTWLASRSSNLGDSYYTEGARCLGVINSKLEIVIPFVFQYITSYKSGFFFASNDGNNWYVLNQEGEILTHISSQ